MSIQLSVIIWTVICFFVLILILDNLLFKPMLELMDSRKEKIESARAKKAKADEDKEQNRIVLERQLKEEYEHAQQQVNADIAAAREIGECTISECHGKKITVLSNYENKLTEEYSEMFHSLDSRVNELATVFVSGFLN